MALIKGGAMQAWWLLLMMTCIPVATSLPTDATSTHDLMNMWPSVQQMPISQAINILQAFGIGVDTEEPHRSIMTSENDITKAYETLLQQLLTQAEHCNASEIYRSADGVCNNIDNPLWGAVLHSQRRLLQNSYLDGSGIPRLTGIGFHYLPSARTVSLECFPPNKENADYFDRTTSQMVMQFGQYLDHDIIFTETLDGSGCCDDAKETCVHPHVFNGGPCFPIVIEEGDRYFNTSCMPFKRSFAITQRGVREQVNGITSYVDASQVYGTSDQQQELLRSQTGGLLKVSQGNQLPMLGPFKCVKGSTNKCPFAGDSRVSVFPGLTVLHTMFHREHNRIAKGLHKVNPHWDNERLFQEARKIVIAIHQKITFEDFLPIIIGKEVMSIFGIDEQYKYAPKMDASIINSFGTAAFRYGHSQINGILKINGTSQPISKLYFRSYMSMNENIIKEVIREQARGLGQKTNEEFTTEINDKLFLGVDAPNLSTDLAARNTQRARDHGNAPYLEYFDYCRSKMNHQPIVSQFNLPKCLQSNIYKSVYDVDLFVGGLHEHPVHGGLVGPTFACIIGEQFKRLKFGDRFFYETDNTALGFTASQLKEIKQETLSGVLCRNSGSGRLQRDIFRPLTREGSGNGFKRCSEYKDIDFTKWRTDS